MKKYFLFFVGVYISAFLFNADAWAKSEIASAPVDKILEKQALPPQTIREYQASVINSYVLLPQQLDEILQNEYQKINAETIRMQKIKQYWNSAPAEYRLLNYMLNEQISTTMSQSRKRYQKRKNIFSEFVQKAPKNKSIYLIEATNPCFFYQTIRETNADQIKHGLSMSFSSHGIHYVSLFDSQYRHIFTYHRQHVNMIKNRQFNVAKTRNVRVNNSFQKLFDDYIIDLQRIGAGLDITNSELLRQLGEMKNRVRSE